MRLPGGPDWEAERYNGYDLDAEPVPLSWVRNTATLGEDWITFDSPFSWAIHATSDLGMVLEDEIFESVASWLESVMRQEEILYGVQYDYLLAGDIVTSYGIGEMHILRANAAEYGRGGAEGFVLDQQSNLALLLGNPVGEWETRTTRWDDEVSVGTFADTGLDGQVLVVSIRVEEDVVWSVTCKVTPLVDAWWSSAEVEELCWGILGSVAYGHQFAEDMRWAAEGFPEPSETTTWEEADMVRVEDRVAKLEYRFPVGWRYGWYFGPDVNEPFAGETGRPYLDLILGSDYGDLVEATYPAGPMFVLLSEESDPALVKSIAVAKDVDRLGLPLVPHAGMEGGEIIELGEGEAWLTSHAETIGAGEGEYELERTGIRIADPSARLQRGVLTIACEDPAGESREICIDFARSISAYPAQGEFWYYDVLAGVHDDT